MLSWLCMKPAVDIRHLTVRVGHTPLLEDIHVSLPQGKVIGLLGPSGAGKTTLMRTIVGRQKPTAGSVLVLGLPAGDADLRTHVGYVTQAPSVYRDLTVAENMRYFAALSNVSAARVREVLASVGLAVYEKRLAATLSGGQLSRLSLAAALLGRPRLLVLDEPTVGIDPLLRRELWNQFRQLAVGGVTLLVSSHVMDEAAHCDELVLLRDGKLLAYGTQAELLRRSGTKTIENAFLALEAQR